MSKQVDEINELELEGKTTEEIRVMAVAKLAALEAAETANADLEETTDTGDSDPEEFIFRKEIDLGDGSGKQVFTGKGATELEAYEALTDSLANAQTNASKKIRELSSKVKEQPVEKTYTGEEEFVYSQELISKPTEGFKKLFKELTGYEIQDFKTKIERVDAFEAAQRASAVQSKWMAQHPEYIANNENATRLGKQCELNGDKEFTVEGLEKAYLTLKESGLLEIKAEGADVDTKQKDDTKQRIAASHTDVSQQRSRRSSTVTSRGRSTPIKTEPTEDELYSMPLDKLRNLANKQLAGE